MKINARSSTTPVNAMFRFVKPDKQGYYLIESAESQDYAMDVAGGKTDNGTPVHGWTKK